MIIAQRYQFCPKCGGPLSLNESQDVNRPKCRDCGFVFFQNPSVGVAAILIRNKKVLLGRRIGSYSGQWCIPCGYVEYTEEVKAALIREMKEETGLDFRLGEIFAVHSNFHNPAQHTVGLWFLAEAEGEPLPMDDLDQVGFFALEDLERQSMALAFPTDRLVLQELKARGLIE